MQNLFKISFVIPSRGEYFVNNLLQDLLVLDNIEQHEIILVLNTKNKSLFKKFKEKYPFVNVLESQRGVNAARNLGLRSSRGEVIYFLDSDMRVKDNNFIQKVTNVINSNPEIDIFGGGYVLPSNPSYIQSYYHHVFDIFIRSGIYLKSNFNLLGGNLILTLRSQKKYPNFNDSIMYGGSETEFLLRCAADFTLVFKPELSLVHECKINIINLIIKTFKQGYTYGNLVKKYPEINNLITSEKFLLTKYYFLHRYRGKVFQLGSESLVSLSDSKILTKVFLLNLINFISFLLKPKIEFTAFIEQSKILDEFELR